MSVASIEPVQHSRGLSRALAHIPAWLWVGAGACVLVLLHGGRMLRDTDTFWQIRVGQWIIDHHAMPRVDIYSLTKAGAPWLSSSWLSQVLFAGVYALAGWTGVVLLSALAITATFALLVHVLERRIPATYACFVAIVAFALSAHHFLARPHVLAMPVMVAWVGGLIAASDRRVRPSFLLLPLIALWANLHGGFVLGLALIGPIALDALWNAQSAERKPLAVQWALFGLAALLACCLTPYGWNSLLAARKILDLGELLTLISEWAPMSFASFGMFEGCLLLLIGAALYAGVVLPPTRILLTLGLLHMALNHIRNIEVFALLLPIVLLAPLATQFAAQLGRAAPPPGTDAQPRRFGMAVAIVLTALAIGALASTRHYQPEDEDTYASAIAALREHKAVRVFNDYGFGGYMIWAGLPPFIDGRAELYGEKFALEHFKATSLADPETFTRLLDGYRIDATIMYPTTPAARLLDHIDGWTKVFANDLAVVHVRTAPVSDAPLRLKGN
jgi:hypothetical protein